MFIFSFVLFISFYFLFTDALMDEGLEEIHRFLTRLDLLPDKRLVSDTQTLEGLPIVVLVAPRSPTEDFRYIKYIHENCIYDRFKINFILQESGINIPPPKISDLR